MLIGVTPGASRGCEAGRPRSIRVAGGWVCGVPTNTVRCDDTPRAYGTSMVCSRRRTAVQSPNSASATTAVTVIPEARTCRSNERARRHFSWNTTVAGMRPRARCAGVNHVAGRYRLAPPPTPARPSTAPR